MEKNKMKKTHILIVIVTLVVIASVLLLVSYGGKFDWPDNKLGNMVPHIDGVKGEIGYDNPDSLYIILEEITARQYLDYLEECQSMGFSISISEKNNSFTAFNEDGYKIDISYFSSGDMWITIDEPISMSTFEWPNSDIAKLLPKPSSNYGKIEWESEEGFVIYVGNTTQAGYQNYVHAVSNRGFILNCNQGDYFYYAENLDGYSINLKYEGFDIMFIQIDDSNDEESSDTSDIPNGDLSGDNSDNKDDSNDDNSSGNNDNEESDKTETVNITADNNLDFKNLLDLRDPSDASIAVFANKYADQIIEFDGCVLAMNNHGSYNTRYDILIGAGNYDADSVRGPGFRLTDVGAYDMKLDTMWVEDVLCVGTNIHIVAKVGKYNPITSIFELDVISVVVR